VAVVRFSCACWHLSVRRYSLARPRSIKACPLRNPLDELASQGSGPRLLEQP
jgi:hypothetical protein